MTALEKIQQLIATDLQRLNDLIRSELSSSNILMNTVIDNYLESKGKQIRPIIVILCAKMFGTVSEQVLQGAAAVELLHNASLIHDDVVDDSKLRRNRPTINSIWDNHIAVLVGDYFVSTALREAIATSDMRIVASICDLGKMLSLGEIDQIYNARHHSLTEESYYKIISYKTASLFVACAKVGCYASAAPDDALAKLSRVAELLGLCFQIRDDIFDYYPSEKVGKPTGNDLREGKITLPLLHALSKTDVAEHAQMTALAGEESLSDDKIARLQAFARDNGGIEYAVSEMQRLRNEAFALLDTLPDGDARRALMSIFDYMIERDY